MRCTSLHRCAQHRGTVQLSSVAVQQGATALHMAADMAYVDMIQVLVDAGADVLAQDHQVTAGHKVAWQ